MEEGQESLIKFETPSTIVVSGATSTGKSWLIYKILKYAKGMFTSPLKKIIYCYGVYQDFYDDMQRDIPNIEFFSGLPTRDDLESWNYASQGLRSLFWMIYSKRLSKTSILLIYFVSIVTT